MKKKVIIERGCNIAFVNGIAFDENDSVTEVINNIKYLLQELDVEIEIIES